MKIDKHVRPERHHQKKTDKSPTSGDTERRYRAGGAPQRWKVMHMDENIDFSLRRIVSYSLTAGWLLLVPVFIDQSDHFGWGFLPYVISHLLVPCLAVGIGIDLIIRLFAAYLCSRFCSMLIRVAAVAVPLFLLLLAVRALLMMFGNRGDW